MKHNHLLRKLAVTLVVLIIVLFVLHMLELVLVGSIWFIVLFSLLGVILPTLIWTSIKTGKERRAGK